MQTPLAKVLKQHASQSVACNSFGGITGSMQCAPCITCKFAAKHNQYCTRLLRSCMSYTGSDLPHIYIPYVLHLRGSHQTSGTAKGRSNAKGQQQGGLYMIDTGHSK